MGSKLCFSFLRKNSEKSVLDLFQQGYLICVNLVSKVNLPYAYQDRINLIVANNEKNINTIIINLGSSASNLKKNQIS